MTCSFTTSPSDRSGAHFEAYFCSGGDESSIPGSSKSCLVVTEKFHDELGGTIHGRNLSVSQSVSQSNNTWTSDWVGLEHIL